jgi:hypothetical protein
VYDILNIVPYLRKHGKHPVTGAPCGLGDLIHLTFHKNSGVVTRARVCVWEGGGAVMELSGR